MASRSESILSRAENMGNKDSASKRKRVNRLAKLKQCKREARRDQWLANQVKDEKQGENSLHAEGDACVNDPGEVLNPEFASTEVLLRVSWASLSSNSTERRRNPHSTARFLRTQAEPDPDLLHANSCLRIKRPESSSFPSINKHVDNVDASPKSCEDRSPKSKASKMGKGSRRSRNDRGNSKEYDSMVAGQKDNKVQQRKFETRAPTNLQDRRCYVLEMEDGWEAAVDVLGLHSVPKKPCSGVLQVKVTPRSDEQNTGTNTTPLLCRMPAKKPVLQHSVHQRAWMQNDVGRPPSLPILNKQRGLRASTDPLDKPQCPICIEDLDSTDTLFESCACGFSLCLFCYHQIALENGRCPACRGVYIRDISAKPAVLLPR